MPDEAETTSRTHTAAIPELVRFAAASGDFNDIHYDRGQARAKGLPDVILPGLLKAAWLAELAVDVVGGDWVIAAFDVSYRGLDVIGESHEVHARVESRDEESCALSLWGSNPRGEKTTLGSARFVRAGGRADSGRRSGDPADGVSTAEEN